MGADRARLKPVSEEDVDHHHGCWLMKVCAAVQRPTPHLLLTGRRPLPFSDPLPGSTPLPVEAGRWWPPVSASPQELLWLRQR